MDEGGSDQRQVSREGVVDREATAAKDAQACARRVPMMDFV